MDTQAPVVAFLFGLALTSLLTVGCVLYLHRNLLPLLVELCGTRERAAFWAAFTNTLLTISPIVGALVRTPRVAPGWVPVFKISSQLAMALAWLGMGLMAVGLVLSRFILQAAR